MLKNMFKKTYTKVDIKHQTNEIPADLWRKCNKCGKAVYVEQVYENKNICPKCGAYFRIDAYRRINMIADAESFVEWDCEMEISNPLQFPGYEKKTLAVREKTGLNEAIVTGRVRIGGYPAGIGVCDARFLMSSMGHNMGEKRKIACNSVCLLRRSKNAGRNCFLDADGKNVSGIETSS